MVTRDQRQVKNTRRISLEVEKRILLHLRTNPWELRRVHSCNGGQIPGNGEEYTLEPEDKSLGIEESTLLHRRTSLKKILKYNELSNSFRDDEFRIGFKKNPM